MSESLEVMSAMPLSAGVRAALDGIRVESTVLLHESYATGWELRIPDRAGLAALLGAAASTSVLAFHALARGACTLQRESGGMVPLRVGEIALVASGDAHEIRCGGDATPVPLDRWLAARGADAGSCAAPIDGAETVATLICGALAIRGPLMPQVLRSLSYGNNATTLASPLVSAVLATLVEPAASPPLARNRLLEFLCANVLAAALQSSEGALNALAAVDDRVLAPVVAAIRREPGRPWTLATVARMVHRSPSRLAARFRRVVGVSPGQFIIRCRLDHARDLLATGDLSVEAVAAAVGYASASALSKALMREHQLRPGAVRPGAARQVVAGSRERQAPG